MSRRSMFRGKCRAAREPSLVTNARCLTEGVDVPKIDCVLFADPKGSTIDVVQAVGRALRLAAGKMRGHIIIPFVVPEGAALEAAAESAGFAFVVFVLRALASTDERIVDELRAISRGQPPKTGRILNFDVSAIFPIATDAEQFINAIELKCWGRLAKLAPMPYEDAREFVQKLGIRNQKQFRAYRCGRFPELPPVPDDLSGSPNSTYKGSGWVSWGEFFGTGYVSSKLQSFRPFQDARVFVRTLGLKNPREWELYRCGKHSVGLKPKDIPSRPNSTYKTEWVSWGDWLGYDPKINRLWMPFFEAREFVRKLNLSGQTEWEEYRTGRMPHLPKKPQNIPSHPYKDYKEDGWRGYGDWVGTGNQRYRRVVPRSFNLARDFARSLNLNNQSDWKRFARSRINGALQRPPDIPGEPNKTYAAQGWAGWDDWLGRS